jgi:putative ABC transport system permease protein
LKATGKIKEALATLEKIYKELNPKFPFTYTFSEDAYAKLYRSVMVVSKLANYFALLGNFISCLGSLALAIFAAEQRPTEFGIRKVLGARPLSCCRPGYYLHCFTNCTLPGDKDSFRQPGLEGQL